MSQSMPVGSIDRDLLLHRPAKSPHPNDFTGLGQLAERLLDFQYYWEATAKPFEWKFTKADLAKLLAKLAAHEKAAA